MDLSGHTRCYLGAEGGGEWFSNVYSNKALASSGGRPGLANWEQMASSCCLASAEVRRQVLLPATDLGGPLRLMPRHGRDRHPELAKPPAAARQVHVP
jgi:hypothetical protein